MLSKSIHPDWAKEKCVGFNKSLKSTDKQVEIIVEYFKTKISGSRTTPEQKKVLRLFIGNLLNAYELGVNLECYIGNQDKARRTIKDKLVQCKLVEYYRGSHFEGGDAYSSKMMALPLFNDLFHPLIRVTTEDSKGNKTRSRGEDPEMMDRIFAYNEFMENHIVLDGSGNKLKTNIHRCHRIYYGDKTEYKYRFHQSSYQSMPSDERSKIKIDGEAVVRFDITGCHPQILHNLAGYEMKHKPYEAFPDHLEMVEVCKCALLMIINNGSRKSAIGAFNKELRDNTARFLESIHCMKEYGIKTKEVFDKVETLNPKISHRFYKSACRELMDIEADIFFETMEILKKYSSIPTIQIYDELICPASHEKHAKLALELVWKKHLTFIPKMTIKRLEEKASSSLATLDYLKLYVA